jgi:hypothetical protein
VAEVPLGLRERLYIVRIWIDDGGVHRASVKNLRTKRSHYFGSVEGLLRFLAQATPPDR